MNEETKLAIMETNLSHLAGKVDDLSETMRQIQQLQMEERRNRHDIEVLQRDKSEIKTELDEIRTSLKTISDSVNSNSFLGRAIISIASLVTGAVIVSVVNMVIK